MRFFTQTEHMRCTAVILAGGKGSRFGNTTGGLPKQFLQLGDRSSLEHSIAAFDSHSAIDDILIVMREEHIPHLKSLLATCSFSKISAIIAGGAERMDSSLAAIHYFPADEQRLILFHDAVRPLVSAETITAAVAGLTRYDALTAAIPCTDTVLKTSSDGCITDIPPRAEMMLCQTPQAFKLATIRHAYALAKDDPEFSPTDDCGVVSRYLPDTPIATVLGSAENLKVTHPHDQAIALHYLDQR